MSARTTSPAPAATSRSARSATTPGSTSPSNGQPNATLIVAVEGRSATARIRSTRAVASSSDALPLRWLKDSVAASVTLTRSSGVAARRSQPRSLSTRPGELGLDVADRRDDLLRAGHLRHALVADEAGRLDPREAGRREPANELGANLRRERLGLVLEPVAGADVAERDAHASRLLVLEGFERIELGRASCREDRGEDADDDGRDREDDELRAPAARTR